jgi:hypothetical protein
MGKVRGDVLRVQPAEHPHRSRPQQSLKFLIFREKLILCNIILSSIGD